MSFKYLILFLVLNNLSHIQAQTSVFKEVQIGNQVWMQENLNIPILGSLCYENKPENCEKYGCLYTWDAAMNVCPEGWHLPSLKEWKVLVEYLGGEQNARKELKLGGNSGFDAMMTGGTDTEESFLDMDIKAYFWTSTETKKYSTDYAWYTYLFEVDYEDYANAPLFVIYSKRGTASVRCIKD